MRSHMITFLACAALAAGCAADGDRSGIVQADGTATDGGGSCGDCEDSAPHCVDGSCEAVIPACPTVEIGVEPGLDVVPGTDLQLTAHVSSAAGEITDYAWSITSPHGPPPAFEPGADAEAPMVTPHVVGTYTIRLEAWDAHERQSCETATAEVHVVPDAGIHIELTWHTPHDPDETDSGFDIFGQSAGTDVDLHVTHPSAVGIPEMGNRGWFDSLYDCYWQNRNPNWGDRAGNRPNLVRDDADGAGPEIVSLATPEAGATYGIGVHYWDDWGFGQSLATIRVYVHGGLRYERADVPMGSRDMWEVGAIHWPSGDVTAPAEPAIIEGFWNPTWGF